MVVKEKDRHSAENPSDEEILLTIRKAFNAGFEAGRIDGAQRGINPFGTAEICNARFLDWMETTANDSRKKLYGL